MADSHSTPDIAVSGTERHLIVDIARKVGIPVHQVSPFPASGYAQPGSIPESTSRLR